MRAEFAALADSMQGAAAILSAAAETASGARQIAIAAEEVAEVIHVRVAARMPLAPRGLLGLVTCAAPCCR